jgi:uncharacterized protein YndB with AHSA1/START domain
MNLTDLTVSHTIPATAERVFDVWINPKSPGGPWFGADRVILNPVVDGLFYLAVKHGGRTWPHYGRFLQIDRPSRIQYTWMSEATKGAESIVTVVMEARGDQTEVTLHQLLADHAAVARTPGEARAASCARLARSCRCPSRVLFRKSWCWWG